MLRSRLPQIAATLDPRIDAALRAGGEAVSQAAKARAPVETGRLRDSIHVEDADDGVAVVAGDSDVFYGQMVEFGTAHSPARPFLIPALEDNRDSVLVAVNAALRTL